MIVPRLVFDRDLDLELWTMDSGLSLLNTSLVYFFIHDFDSTLVRLDLELLDAVLDHSAEVRVGEAALDKLVLVQTAVTCTSKDDQLTVAI